MQIANRAIQIIASHGRKFFSLYGDIAPGIIHPSEPDRISRFEVRHSGQLWFIDKYKKKSIYVAYRERPWVNFSEGAILRVIVCAMADWIIGRLDSFPMDKMCDRILFGYGDDLAKVRAEITELLAQFPTMK